MQRTFAIEYAIDDSSASAAAVRAGYTNQSADAHGPRMTRDARIQKVIEDTRAILDRESAELRRKVISELTAIAFSRLTKYYVTDPLTGETSIDIQALNASEDAAAIEELSVSLFRGKKTASAKVSSKLPALMALGKELGMFREKVEVKHDVNLLKLIEQSFEPPQIIDSTAYTSERSEETEVPSASPVIEPPSPQLELPL
jgi:phage terminase small subunit